MVASVSSRNRNRSGAARRRAAPPAAPKSSEVKILWWDGSAKMRGVDAALAYETISSMGGNDPEKIVRAAEPLGSPIHPWFEWDDSAAASKYRLQQAERLVRSLRIEYAHPDRGRHQAPAFVSVSPLNLPARSPERWVTTLRALNDAEMRSRVLDRAKREIQEWADRYERFDELAAIVATIRRIGGEP